MREKAKRTPMRYVLAIYLLCFIFRAVEYLFLRTDQSIVGEALVHKLLGIAVLGLAALYLGYHWRGVGFVPQGMPGGTAWGLLLGCGVMAAGYAAEMLLLGNAGQQPSLQFYATSYTTQGNRVLHGSVWFVLLCIAGNIVNVIVEEGVFRGLFVRMLEEKYSFLKACLISSGLFGLWHIAQPLRSLLDGEQSPMGAAMAAVLLVGTSLLGGIQYCMLLKLTGALWAGMAAHFANNTLINLLHVVSAAGADQMQTLRITVAQTLSFTIVLVLFIARRAYRAPTFRQ